MPVSRWRQRHSTSVSARWLAARSPSDKRGTKWSSAARTWYLRCMEKTCATCAKEKPLTDFPREKQRGTWYYRRRCKACTSTWQTNYIKSRPEAYALVGARATERKRMLMRLIREYLLAHPCVDCGDENPIILQFDHVRDKKVAGIGEMVRRGLSWSKISDEIKKCDVRCANCHTKRTAISRGYYAFMGP